MKESSSSGGERREEEEEEKDGVCGETDGKEEEMLGHERLVDK
jgi:hypothetical protein